LHFFSVAAFLLRLSHFQKNATVTPVAQSDLMQRKIPRIRRFPMSEVGPEIAVFIFLSIGAISLFSFVAVASWSDARRKEREAYYKNDALKKIAESPAPSALAALEYMREQNRNAARRRREGISSPCSSA
jgi:hypothetical protein